MLDSYYQDIRSHPKTQRIPCWINTQLTIPTSPQTLTYRMIWVPRASCICIVTFIPVSDIVQSLDIIFLWTETLGWFIFLYDIQWDALSSAAFSTVLSVQLVLFVDAPTSVATARLQTHKAFLAVLLLEIRVVGFLFCITSNSASFILNRYLLCVSVEVSSPQVLCSVACSSSSRRRVDYFGFCCLVLTKSSCFYARCFHSIIASKCRSCTCRMPKYPLNGYMITCF